jgi:hypothetical protein
VIHVPFWQAFTGAYSATSGTFALVSSPDSLACFCWPEEQFVDGNTFDVPACFTDLTACSIADKLVAPTTGTKWCSFKVGRGRWNSMFAHRDI